MRIISALAIFAIAASFPSGKALAAEIKESNETKINFKIQNNGITESPLSFESEISALSSKNYDSRDLKELAIERPEEIEEKKKKTAQLKKYSRLPQGQFFINASAYTAAADECGKSDGITASGVKVKEKETIACPPQFSFGTKLKIEGMGTYICQDRGGAIKGNHIDIYMETKSEAFAFGRRTLLAEVIE
jgi:3D (Asp-Asp-Asp) domain-containing protein